MNGVAGAFAQTTATPGTPANATAPADGTTPANGSADLPAPLVELAEFVPDWVLNAGAAILVIVLAYVASHLIIRLFGRRLARRFRRPSLTRTAIRGIRVAVFLLAFFVILDIYDLGLENIALSVTVFTAVVGVVLAPIVGSVISGVFLLADQPYEIGDMIEIAETDTQGFVEDITLRYTKIFTLDNTFLVIPNGTMRDRDVYNYSAEDTRVRLDLDVVVTYESDVAEARQLIQTATRSVDAVISGGPDIRIGSARYPAAPTCYIDRFGDHGVALRLRYWVKEPYRLLAIRSAVQTAVWERLADADVEIAYPHSHMVFDDTSGELQVATRDNENPSSSGERDAGPDRP